MCSINTRLQCAARARWNLLRTAVRGGSCKIGAPQSTEINSPLTRAAAGEAAITSETRGRRALLVAALSSHGALAARLLQLHPHPQSEDRRLAIPAPHPTSPALPPLTQPPHSQPPQLPPPNPHAQSQSATPPQLRLTWLWHDRDDRHTDRDSLRFLYFPHTGASNAPLSPSPE